MFLLVINELSLFNVQSLNASYHTIFCIDMVQLIFGLGWSSFNLYVLWKCKGYFWLVYKWDPVKDLYQHLWPPTCSVAMPQRNKSNSRIRCYLCNYFDIHLKTTSKKRQRNAKNCFLGAADIFPPFNVSAQFAYGAQPHDPVAPKAARCQCQYPTGTLPLRLSGWPLSYPFVAEATARLAWQKIWARFSFICAKCHYCCSFVVGSGSSGFSCCCCCRRHLSPLCCMWQAKPLAVGLL